MGKQVQILLLKICRMVNKILIKDGNVNPMVPGKKVVAIFGFCDIHHFNIVNEVLQEVIKIYLRIF